MLQMTKRPRGSRLRSFERPNSTGTVSIAGKIPPSRFDLCYHKQRDGSERNSYFEMSRRRLGLLRRGHLVCGWTSAPPEVHLCEHGSELRQGLRQDSQSGFLIYLLLTKGFQYIGWLADEPWSYYRLNGCILLDEARERIGVNEFPTRDTVRQHCLSGRENNQFYETMAQKL